MNATLRPVRPMHFPDIVPGGADMPRPVYEEVDPRSLLIDESYQRNLSERSRALIRHLIIEWDWRAFKPPNCVRVGDERHVIDGQHTAIAAASHPLVGKIPVLIVVADSHAQRAHAFVRLNRDRITVTPTQLHHALVQAGDEDALTIDQVCQRAGVRIMKNPSGQMTWNVGDTAAVSTVQALVRRRHAAGARRILEVLVKAKMAPLSMAAMRAVESLLFEDTYAKPRVDPDDVATVIREAGDKLERDAKVRAAKTGTSAWSSMADLLYARARSHRGR